MRQRISELPIFLIMVAMASVAMFVPAIYAVTLEAFEDARAFFYSGTLGLFLTVIIGLTLPTGRAKPRRDLDNLLALFAAFTVLPVALAVPFHESVGTTSFVNAYFEMVSCLTTTGASLFDAAERLTGAQNLWRAQVGWMGGLLIWVSAAAVLAPLNLGGFEVTATAEPGVGDLRADRFQRADANRRLWRVLCALFPIYAGLTLVLWLCLLVSGDAPLVAISHAMSTMATSGISPIGGVSEAGSGRMGEVLVFLFLLFALSRLTFSTDTITTARKGLHLDPEIRAAMMLVIGVPVLLFLRHWLAAFEVDETKDLVAALQAFWGSMFTVLSFLTTTGFESADWAEARDWSGLGTPGIILMALSLVGGGVATTAGGVKLLRVYALYRHGARELERLVHPASVARRPVQSHRIQKKGAFIAWIFFMLFALSLAGFTVIMAALGLPLENAFVLSIAALSTTGPLIEIASASPVQLAEMSNTAKYVLSAAMALGRMETLAFIALLNPDLWRR